MLELGIVLVGGLIPAIIKPQFKAKTKPAFLCGLYMMSLTAFAVDTNSGVRGISICAFSMSISFMVTCPFFMGVYWTVSGWKVPRRGGVLCQAVNLAKVFFAD